MIRSIEDEIKETLVNEGQEGVVSKSNGYMLKS